MLVRDYFSVQSGRYRECRPTYPDGLFRYLTRACRRRELAWDVATGNGHAAEGLAAHFQQVYATDVSRNQILNAVELPNILYEVADERFPTLKKRSVDLVTVAQALHWLDTDAFYPEVRRVLKKYGVLACWAYQLPSVCPEVDNLLAHFYGETLGPYWHPARKLVDLGYRTIHIPFREMQTPRFEIRLNWNLIQFLGYLETWSAVKHYSEREGRNPLQEYREQFEHAWGNPEYERPVTWPIVLKMGCMR